MVTEDEGDFPVRQWTWDMVILASHTGKGKVAGFFLDLGTITGTIHPPKDLSTRNPK